MSATSYTDEASRSSEDIQVWSIVLNRIRAIADSSTWHHPCYVRNLEWLYQFKFRPPHLLEINEWLESTGWRIQYVDGYAPADVYRALHANRIFPVSRSLRRLKNISYTAAPDFVHDVLGHVPMLFDEDYRTLIQRWGELARFATPTAADRALVRAMSHLERLRMAADNELIDARQAVVQLREAQAAAVVDCSRFLKFETFYTWAIEFGVLRSSKDSSPILIGGAALSSPGELVNIFSGKVRMRAFSDGAIGHPVDYTRYQPCLFEARTFQEYFVELESI